MRVLIADDEPYARKRLNTLLTEAGCEVVSEHRDGESVLEWLEAHPRGVDALFLDVQMPELGGLEVAAELDGTLPIVFVTGHKEHAIRAWEFAAAGFLSKPITPQQVEQQVERVRARLETPRHFKGAPMIRIRSGPSRKLAMPLADVEYFEVSDRVITAKIKWADSPHEVAGMRSLHEVETAFPGQKFERQGRFRLALVRNS